MRINKVSLNVAAGMVASLSLFGGSGFAETMIANVPFQFQVQNRLLPAGKYSVSNAPNGDPFVILVRNWTTRQSVFILPLTGITPGANNKPRMVFQCGEDNCFLSEIWGATPGRGAVVAPPRHSGQPEKITQVYLAPQKSGP